MNAAGDVLRLHWFGGFTAGRAFGTVFLLSLAYLAYRMDAGFLAVVALLMLSTGYLSGWTEIDLARAQVRRTVYFLWWLPVWRRTVSLRQGGRLCVTFRPSHRDRHGKWHERDFTVIDLRYGPRDWIQLAQTDRSRGNFCPAMLARARHLAARLHIPLEACVERVPGAVEHNDRSADDPPPELRHRGRRPL